ncbi:hypothetical protein BX600DRAFT_470071 [Xylariales sp. PMI_506]|nr:hypothetical protein BX600DRAFT_470071 [Xylariales sp. PMI_506]
MGNHRGNHSNANDVDLGNNSSFILTSQAPVNISNIKLGQRSLFIVGSGDGPISDILKQISEAPPPYENLPHGNPITPHDTEEGGSEPPPVKGIANKEEQGPGLTTYLPPTVPEAPSSDPERKPREEAHPNKQHQLALLSRFFHRIRRHIDSLFSTTK